MVISLVLQENLKENNMFLTKTTPNNIEVLIDNMKVNKGVGPNSMPTKILKDYKTEFLLLLLQQVYYPLPLKWQILFLFIRKVTSLTAAIIDPYLFFLTLVQFLRK